MAKHQKILTWVLYAALGLLGLWAGFRFVLPWAAPFLLALLTARLIEPLVRLLIRKWKMKRAFAAILCSALTLALMLTLVGLGISQAMNGASNVAQNLPDIAAELGYLFSRVERRLYHFVIAAPVETQAMIQTAIDSVTTMFEEMPNELSSVLLSFATSVAAAFPRVFLFVLTYAISVLFMSMSYPQVIGFLLRQIPLRWHDKLRRLRQDLRGTFIKWLKAQAKLIGVTFVILTVAFFVLRVNHALLFAALIAVIDALPVLGTGTVLIPWAILSLVSGDVTLGAGLAITYGLVSITHSVMEPRFVGQQLGLHPVATLMAMYLGFRVIGVFGMITFPMLLLFVKQIHDQGHIRLWR